MQVPSQNDVREAGSFVQHERSSGRQPTVIKFETGVKDEVATRPRNLSAIRASLKRIGDAIEQLQEEAATKLQAVARGKQVRTRMARLEKNAITLQRWFRQIERQRKGAGRPHSAAAVVAASGHRKEWAMEFQNSASGGGLEQAGFLQAVSRACGAKVSPVQAEQLWTGFLEQNDAGLPMSLATFWAICEAVLLGDAHAAEFAAITQEEYLRCMSESFAYAGITTHILCLEAAMGMCLLS